MRAADVVASIIAEAARPNVCIAISGSTARGTADRYSDLDLCVIADNYEVLAPMPAIVREVLARIGDPLTEFVATHLGVDNLFIFFTEIQGSVVKVDLELALIEDVRRPPELTALSDPDGIFPRLRQREATIFDVDLASRRITGWLWYAYTKLARGEIFEAVDALDTIRKLAFVPLLLDQAGATIEGYRRLENKLDAATLGLIRSTYPSDISAAEIQLALTRTGRAFRDRVSGVNSSLIGRMLEAIERDQR